MAPGPVAPGPVACLRSLCVPVPPLREASFPQVCPSGGTGSRPSTAGGAARGTIERSSRAASARASASRAGLPASRHRVKGPSGAPEAWRRRAATNRDRPSSVGSSARVRSSAGSRGSS
ncbi:hypothetical protein B6E66_01455 [Streptomyces maremycinicus]|nr:hypothetical protein B6E66_01455 [Streptomyces sp. B9173]